MPSSIRVKKATRPAPPEKTIKLHAGEIFPLPTFAVPEELRAHDVSDDDSDCNETYDPLPPLKKDELHLSEMMLNMNIDIDGREMIGDCIFKTYDQAANFTPMTLPWKGFVEIPCVVLWDYFGGNTCMDVNVLDNDVVKVVAEEYQVRGATNYFLRIPIQWSLVHVSRSGIIGTTLGIMPSSWIIPEKFYYDNNELFQNPYWSLGVCSVDHALTFLLEDVNAATPGLFVIFSPPWLNVDPQDHRPYILLMLTEHSKKMDPTQMFAKMPKLFNAADYFRQAIREAEEDDKKESKTSHSRHRSRFGNVGEGPITVDQEIDAIIRHAGLPYKARSFTITRSYMGDYELFGKRYSTLFDLVYYLAHNKSELPHKLVYGRFSLPPPFPWRGVPPPLEIVPRRDPDALEMKSEQWAAKHYSQSTEPICQSSPFTFATRNLFEPSKKVHMDFAKSAGLDPGDVIDARNTCTKLTPDPKKQKTAIEGPKNPNVEIAKDIMAIGEALIQIDIKNMIFDHKKPLGHGEFGAVYKGKVNIDGISVNAAIKSLRLNSVDKDTKLPWLQEVEALHMINHPNVVQFYGFSLETKDRNVLLAFELAEFGSLDGFCKTLEFRLSSYEMIDFLIQIARGLGHLHTREPCIVHGDVAARNVLVTKHPKDSTRYVMKITDFGLAKTYRTDMTTTYDDQTKIPYKWLPPEVLKGRELAWPSDVFSYGMVCHEMYGIGEPYGMMGPERVVHALMDGYRFEKQDKMPHYLYDIVLQCQRRVPFDRPTMRHVELQLSQYLIENDSQHRKVLFERYARQANITTVETDY